MSPHESDEILHRFLSIGFAWTMLHPWTQVGGDSTAGLVLTHTVQTHTVEVGVHFGSVDFSGTTEPFPDHDQAIAGAGLTVY